MEFDRVPFLYLFFLVSFLLAFHAESMSFTNHLHWFSSTIESLRFTNPASLESHRSSPPHIHDHAFQGLITTLHSQYELEVSKKPPRFSFASNEKTFTLYTHHTSSCYGKNVKLIVIHTGVWPESKSFKDNGMTGKVPNKWKGRCEAIIGARFFNKGLVTKTRSIKISRLAIYKVSWDEGRCLFYVFAAMYQDIVDGVDVIFLFFTSCTYAVPSEMDRLAEASFAAMEKGVRVSTVAGYKGQDYETLWNGFHKLAII